MKNIDCNSTAIVIIFHLLCTTTHSSNPDNLSLRSFNGNSLVFFELCW
jgi:hypothetical protein